MVIDSSLVLEELRGMEAKAVHLMTRVTRMNYYDYGDQRAIGTAGILEAQ